MVCDLCSRVLAAKGVLDIKNNLESLTCRDQYGGEFFCCIVCKNPA